MHTDSQQRSKTVFFFAFAFAQCKYTFGRGKMGMMVIDLDWHGAIQSVQLTEGFMSEGFYYEIDKVIPG